MKQNTMKMLPESERPYEKVRIHGAESLSDAELLAVILRSGTKDATARDLAEQILKLGNPDGLPGLLHHTLQDYKEIKGIGNVKAIQLSCLGQNDYGKQRKIKHPLFAPIQLRSQSTLWRICDITNRNF